MQRRLLHGRAIQDKDQPSVAQADRDDARHLPEDLPEERTHQRVREGERLQAEEEVEEVGTGHPPDTTPRLRKGPNDGIRRRSAQPAHRTQQVDRQGMEAPKAL